MQLRDVAGPLALPPPYPRSVIHKGSNQDGDQAQRDEAVLHDLHDHRQHHQVGVEGLEDGPVDVAALDGGDRDTRDNKVTF